MFTNCLPLQANGDAVSKLTEEDAVSQLGSVVDKEGGERSYGTAVTLSGYPRGEGAAPKKTSGVLGFGNKHTDTVSQELNEELSNLLLVSSDNVTVCEKEHLACVTLDLRDPILTRTPITTTQSESKPNCVPDQKKAAKMPHKTAKASLEGKPRSKKDKSAGCHLPSQACKKQENMTGAPQPLTAQQVAKIQENHLPPLKGCEDEEPSLVTVIENIEITEKATSKPHGKKKKKHSQHAAIVKSEAEPLVEVENGARQKTGAKGKIDIFETKPGAKAAKVKDKPAAVPSKKESSPSGADTANSVCEPASPASQLKDDVIKRRRLSEDKFGKRLQKFENVGQIKKEETMAGAWKANKKAFSDVVKTPTQKEAPRQVQPIQAVAVSDDPQSLCLWCQFTAVFTDHTITWTKEGTVMSEVKRSSGDESRVSMNISKASNKDLGRYQCRLSSSHGSLALDYLLTYEVLSEIVIPVITKNIPTAPVEVVGEEEDVRCRALLFREDFLKDQYFGEDQAASLITERVHFGEGMHRRAFRAKLQAGMVATFTSGHPCVLKVHNAVAYGTKNSDEMVQKNYNLAVEECSVQNTAREYINAYNVVARSAEAFGDVPEIIPVYLVHRPSNNIPYATLEEELMGDFVKYSVRDGKEINLMRRDSEAGQKCCCFQHWIYHSTEGNLLVTDMQGVGMRLTDVGIATREKGYKGFKGNCATSFIDQFKALHLCNKYCELLGLKSLQPKPKKQSHAPKSQSQLGAKKKTVGQTVKNKS
ncbi:alpha-protein kinase 2 [Aplochiton taeniatus]